MPLIDTIERRYEHRIRQIETPPRNEVGVGLGSMELKSFEYARLFIRNN